MEERSEKHSNLTPERTGQSLKLAEMLCCLFWGVNDAYRVTQLLRREDGWDELIQTTSGQKSKTSSHQNCTVPSEESFVFFLIWQKEIFLVRFSHLFTDEGSSLKWTGGRKRLRRCIDRSRRQ